MGHQLAGHFCRMASRRGAKPWNPLSWFREQGQAGAQRQHVGTLVQVVDIEKETEADRIAVGLLDAAGFDPHAMFGVATRLSARDDAPGHYRNGRRLSSLQDLVATYPSRPARASAELREVQGDLFATPGSRAKVKPQMPVRARDSSTGP
jgi:predicted Zn-dependent protease